ncbi:MAG: hypothetical protein DWQ04_33585 [Chloroflexi bacterium]|nr:MAG: hypothetical protein DWQ04_33585 [Chloroflexota bacterium]
MFTRKSLLVLAILISSLFAVSLVSADTVSGTGRLHARGNGSIVLRGDVDTLRIHGRGTLFFKDAGETDEPAVTGTGVRIDLPNGWVQYVGFNGTFNLTDADDIVVKLDGRNINLYAAGSGDVWLRGQGHYQYDNGENNITGVWTTEGQAIEIAPAE